MADSNDSGQGGVAPQGADGVLTIKVMGQTGNTMGFRVRTTTRMSVVMDRFCNKFKMQKEHVRFLVDGQRISPDATVADASLEDGDTIACVVEQTGGRGNCDCPGGV